MEELRDLFNLTLGEKLLQHLRKWLDPENLAKAQPATQGGQRQVTQVWKGGTAWDSGGATAGHPGVTAGG